MITNICWHIDDRYMHKPECTCSYVNPVTEWAGGSNVVIIGYRCPMCDKFTAIGGMS